MNTPSTFDSVLGVEARYTALLFVIIVRESIARKLARRTQSLLTNAAVSIERVFGTSFCQSTDGYALAAVKLILSF